jgi:hypothetical protein
VGLFAGSLLHAQTLEDGFVQPPMSVRPDTYWQWMNGNISRDGISRDLKFMHDAGYGSAMIFNVGTGIPKGPVDFFSPEWVECVRQACLDARQLGMTLSLHNAPGYSGTGGPWISPEESMKELVWTDTICEANNRGIHVCLPHPIWKCGYYRDAFILAYPTSMDEQYSLKSLLKSMTVNGSDCCSTLSDNQLNTYIRMEKGQTMTIALTQQVAINHITVFRGPREKPQHPLDGPRDYAPRLTVETSLDGITWTRAGVIACPALRAKDIPGSLDFGKRKVRYLRITTDRSSNLAEVALHCWEPIASKQVRDITACMDANGHLDWKAPHGRWAIVRLGYTTTGETVGAAPTSGIGLECDKMNIIGVDAHFDRYIDPLMRQLGIDRVGVITQLAIDSWEAGKQDWTDNMPEQFLRLRSYDIMPWALTLTGRTIDNPSKTRQFAWDFKRTCTDLFNACYLDRFKQRAAHWGLRYVGEAYGDGNFESLEMAARQDMPMSEYWVHNIYGTITSSMLASSAAHVWGRNTVGCEAFTGTPFNSKFTEHPYGMKAIADYLFATGINRLVYHCTTHQPYTGSQSGNIMTMGPFGTHFDRFSTDAHLLLPFSRYVSRCSWMLHQGQPVVDVLYLKNEDISSGVTNYNIQNPSTPYGYKWDIISGEALLSRIEAERGKMVTPDGMTYRLLVVTKGQRHHPAIAQKIQSLQQNGIPICFADSGQSVEKLLNTLAFIPDFSFRSENANAQIHFNHRRTDNEDIYFIANHRRRPETISVTLRVSGRVPSVWNAETGEICKKVDYWDNGKTTTLNLHLSECGSAFIVLIDPSGSIENAIPMTSNAKNLVPVGTHQNNVATECHDNFSITLWAKPETFAANGRGVILYPSQKTTGDSAEVGIGLGQNGVRVYQRHNKMETVLTVDTAIQGWTHLALVYRNNTPELWINGKKAKAGSQSGYHCVPSPDMERTDERYAASFEGDMSSLEYFPHSLTESQIRQHYQRGWDAQLNPNKAWKDLSTDWTVLFPSWSKAPQSVKMPKLESLRLNANFDVSHFSGTATYLKHFHLTAKEMKLLKRHRAILDLGHVENIAEVSVNHSDSVVIWKAPYRCDITDQLQVGENILEVKVTNVLANRLIGDEFLPEKYQYDQYGQMTELPSWYLHNQFDHRDRVFFMTWKSYKKTDPLLESGLTSKVQLHLE